MPKPDNPYIGPRPFERQDQSVFFGRRNETSQLLSLISAQRALLVYSQSGAGKTSLINASLIPLLETEGFKVFSPARVLYASFKDISLSDVSNVYVFSALSGWLEPKRALSAITRSTFAEFLQCPAGDSEPPRVLIFDQFEEIFTSQPARWRDRSGFFEQLADALRLDPALRAVFVMREDYIASLDPYVSRLPEKLRTRFRLERLGDKAALDAVVGPLQGTSRHYGKGVAEKLVQELQMTYAQDEKGEYKPIVGEFIEPVHLQIICERLWDELPDQVEEITTEHLKTCGDVDTALAEFYANVVSQAAIQTKISEGRIRSWVESRLITGAQTRGTVFRERDETADAPNVLPETLENLHLIRGEWRGGGRWYELTHDRFIMPIRRSNRLWFSEHIFQFLTKWVLQHKPLVGSLFAASLAIIFAAIISFVLIVAARNKALDQKHEAQQQRKRAEAGEEAANKSAASAIKQSKIAQDESLRVRKQNFESQNTIIAMADKLLESATPQEAAIYHIWKMGAFEMLGRNAEAILESNAILKDDPENLVALDRLTYCYNAQKEAEKALAASDAALQKGYDTWSIYQYRANTLGLLGRYKEGEEAFRKSNEKFTASGDESVETHLSPDVQRVTRRKVLVTTELASRGANYYGIANLRAYVGDATFPRALEEARKQPSLGDAALIALNWAWIHMEVRPEDYGALIAQAALWEQAQLPAWAKKYYVEFERAHRQKANPRYGRLAEWAGKRLKELQSVREPVPDAPDAQTLQLEARELLNLKDYNGALKSIDEAVALDPTDASLLLIRGVINWLNGNWQATKRDCNAILEKAPHTSRAHAWRAGAMKQLGEPDSEVEKELRLAVEYDKADAASMIQISDLVATRDPDEALGWLERSRHIITTDEQLAYVHERIARIQLKKKRLPEASKSIETAIAIKRDEPQFYDDRAEIELGISGQASETVVAHHLCEGYFQAGDTRLQLGRKAEALSLYWGSIERLVPLRKSKNKRELDRDIVVAVSKISSVIESTASRAKTSEFWKTAIESGRWTEVRELFEKEERRLSTAR